MLFLESIAIAWRVHVKHLPQVESRPAPTPQPTVNPMTRPEAQIAVVMLCHKNPEHALGAIASMENERHLIEQVYLGDNSCDPRCHGRAAVQRSRLRARRLRHQQRVRRAG